MTVESESVGSACHDQQNRYVDFEDCNCCAYYNYYNITSPRCWAIDESAGRVVALRNVPTTMTKRMVKDLFPFSNLSDTDIEYYNRK